MHGLSPFLISFWAVRLQVLSSTACLGFGSLLLLTQSGHHVYCHWYYLIAARTKDALSKLR
jgi:hypothetical protein